MPPTVSEFIFFQVKPTVRPEDETNEEGKNLLTLMQTVKQESGYQSSSWGRAVEDENTLVWVVDWTDVRGSSSATSLFPPFLQTDTEILTIFVTLTPPPNNNNTETSTLSTNPVTEICALSFPSSMTPDENSKLNADLVNFRSALMDDLPGEQRPKAWAMGWMDRPGTLDHSGSPSGKAMVHLLAVGWANVDAHKAARETEQFKGAIQPIRERLLLPSAQGLGMKHVPFRKL